MLPRDERLSAPAFDRAFKAAVLVKHPLLHLRAKRGTAPLTTAPRAAFVVPKKQGVATARNRLRRRVRECYRLHAMRRDETLRGWDLIFLTTPAAAEADAVALTAAMESVLRRLLARGAPRPNGPEGPVPPFAIAEPSRPAVADGEAGASGPDEEAGLREPEPEPGPAPMAIAATANAATANAATANAATANQGAVGPDATDACTTSRGGHGPFSPAGIALTLIRLYQQWVSPGLPPSCRFYPTCSRYTYEAIELHGLWRGGFLGLCRVCRCHPWNAGGFDPVPGSTGTCRDSSCARRNQ